MYPLWPDVICIAGLCLFIGALGGWALCALMSVGKAADERTEADMTEHEHVAVAVMRRELADARAAADCYRAECDAAVRRARRFFAEREDALMRCEALREALRRERLQDGRAVEGVRRDGT